MSEPVRLYAEQAAASNTCGSCALFRRDSTDMNYLKSATTLGTCGLKPPPWMKTFHAHARIEGGVEVVENSSDWTRVKDCETCSFWRPSGLTYVKDQTWSVP